MLKSFRCALKILRLEVAGEVNTIRLLFSVETVIDERGDSSHKKNPANIQNTFRKPGSPELDVIKIVKENGSWVALDDVENGVVPLDLKKAFYKNPKAFTNNQNFSRGQRKSYLYWLDQAKCEETRQKIISEIVTLSHKNIKACAVSGGKKSIRTQSVKLI